MTPPHLSNRSLNRMYGERTRMNMGQPVYVGNAAKDQVRDTGWFVGQFVPAALGARHQTDVELKWGLHCDGERRSRGPEAVAHATTISILIRGMLRATFYLDGAQQVVTMKNEGDYIIFGPGVVHSWEAFDETLVLSVRYPSIEVHASPVSALSAGDRV
jgi:hypothetical protein